MRYQIPQFIEFENKIIGPLTIKQFIYLAGGGGLAFISYTMLPIYVAIIFIAGFVLLGVALAFYKVNNKPFIDFVESAFLYYTKSKLYIWKKTNKKIQALSSPSPYKQVYVPKVADSKLKELTWTLDVNQNTNPVTGPDVKTN